jgi:hypothetical protein
MQFMPEIPVYHHRIPQTYMKPWCFSNNSIWTFDKNTNKSKVRNIENICGVNHFHSIKAGSLYTNDIVLQKIFGFSMPYKVVLEGADLGTLRDRNNRFLDFDKWEIDYPNGKRVNRRDRHVIYQQLLHTIDTSIEEKWSIEFENDWGKISQQLYDTLHKIQRNQTVALTSYASEIIMKYFVMFEWRGKFGNPTLSNLWQFIFTDVFDGGCMEIPLKDRVYSSDHTIAEEMRHAFLLKSFDEFFLHTGAMFKAYQIYCQSLTFIFLFSDNKKFITSDNPCFTFINKDGLKEPIFAVLPNLLISLAKKDPDEPNSYKIATLTDEQVDEYNIAIIQNGDLILSYDKL